MATRNSLRSGQRPSRLPLQRGGSAAPVDSALRTCDRSSAPPVRDDGARPARAMDVERQLALATQCASLLPSREGGAKRRMRVGEFIGLCKKMFATIDVAGPIHYPFALSRGHSSAGRALQWHCRGRRFDPDWLHQDLPSWQSLPASPSSRGLGHRPFTAVTGVRIPLGTPIFSVRYRIGRLLCGRFPETAPDSLR